MKWLYFLMFGFVGVLAPGWSAAGPGDLYPRGEVFAFSFYSTSEADSRHALANGATALGPFYNGQPQALALANQLNAKLLYKVHPPSMRGQDVRAMEQPGFVWPSDLTISNEVAAIVQAVRTNPSVAMWDIGPEELRSWNPKQLHYLKLVSSVIRANDPERRPIYMYECNNRGSASLAVALAHEDLLTKGTYVNEVDQGAFTHHRIWARWSMEQAQGAVALGNPSAAPWIVLWMARDPAPADFDLIPAWCRHDAYMGLIMGGKGIFVWSAARQRAGFSQRAFDAYFDSYLSVARDLNGPLKLAPVFLFGTKSTNVTMGILSGPKQLELAYQKTTNAYPPVTFLAVEHGGANYLFAVNSAEVPVTAAFAGVPAATRTDLFASQETPTPDGRFESTFAPLEVKGWRFASSENTSSASARPSQNQSSGDRVSRK